MGKGKTEKVKNKSGKTGKTSGTNSLKEFLENLTSAEKKLLMENTRKYAAVDFQEKINNKNLFAIRFILAGENYAIESKDVMGTKTLDYFVPLPKMPDFVVGLTNNRGNIILVINLKKFFGLPGKENEKSNQILLLKNREFEFAVLVDEILGVEEINPLEFDYRLISLDKSKRKFFKGVNAEGIILIDAEKLVKHSSLIIKTKI